MAVTSSGQQLEDQDENSNQILRMETLEFVIYPDGRVLEKVTGIVGASCAEVTAAIEAQLGKVVSQEKTSEYFDQKLEQSVTAAAQATYSQW